MTVKAVTVPTEEKEGGEGKQRLSAGSEVTPRSCFHPTFAKSVYYAPIDFQVTVGRILEAVTIRERERRESVKRWKHADDGWGGTAHRGVAGRGPRGAGEEGKAALRQILDKRGMGWAGRGERGEGSGELFYRPVGSDRAFRGNLFEASCLHLFAY